MRALVATLLLVACSACASRPMPIPSALPGPELEPLRVSPPFDDPPGWAGISMYTNVVAYGWSADSRIFALCGHDDEDQAGFRARCDLLDGADGHLVTRVRSSVDYGDGHPPKDDPSFHAALAPLGVPARPGLVLGARVLDWSISGDHDRATFVLRGSEGSVEIAHVDREGRMGVWPHDAIVSPDGAHLAIVVYRVGGPPLQPAATIAPLRAEPPGARAP